MEFTNEILQKVKTCGALGYTARQIVELLNLSPEDQSDFFSEFTNEQSPLYRAYRQGTAIGAYNIDAGLMKASENGDSEAETALRERKYIRKIEELKNDLFGL